MSRSRLAPFAFAAALASSVAASSCTGDAQFTVKTSKDFARAPMTAAVLGVYKEGRMQPEAWATIGGVLSSPFGAASCPLGLTDDLPTKNLALASAIDDVTRADGVTDDLLAQLAPAANADAIVVFTIAGRPLDRAIDAGSMNTTTMSPTSMMGMGGRRQNGPVRRGVIGRASTYDPNAFEIAASVYSIAQKKSVALIAMRYSGPSTDEALRAFAARLREELPGVSCAPWTWSDRIDPEKVRASAE